MLKVAAIVLVSIFAAGCSITIHSDTHRSMQYAAAPQTMSPQRHYGPRPYSHYLYPGEAAPGVYQAPGRGNDAVNSLCGRLSPASRAEVYQCR